ncbi:PilN domain-containing protein [Acidovorax sp. NCPPB 3576]|uniref:PilN domain-containing protein n=1 Tax=Acidovorax sp. NCPPB 3576 TaxID=2940488 RepID=UPI00234B8CCC|nr:PilN domain-containing protein [Acidovorax sp. NCPPB 3576]WCM89169.1 PilN domain-containing protein [Acidovorax sp. NCPPB 3576]
MPSISSDARFLGIDLHALWRDVRSPWQGMHAWPLFSWLTPSAPVVLLHPEDGLSFWLGDEKQSKVAGPVKASFTAVELPEEFVLRRTLTLPPMAESDIAKAGALEVRAISPFPEADLVWGYRLLEGTAGSSRIELALASRKQVAQYLASQAARLGGVSNPEVWVRSNQQRPIVLGGYGEGLRHAHALRWMRAGYGLLLSMAVLAVAIAVTPTLQLRERAIEAAQSYQDAAKRTAPVVAKRDALMQSAEKLGMLSEVLATRIEPLRALDKLTQLLPDDTYLQSFRMQGAKVTIVGMTGNAAALMQVLGNEPGLREVRAPSAATRMGNSAKETFAIEFTLDPQFFGVVGSATAGKAAMPSTGAMTPALVPAGVASAAASGASVAGASAVPASALPANSSPSAVAPPPASASPSAGGAAFGGSVATFGGHTTTAPALPASSPANRTKP